MKTLTWVIIGATSMIAREFAHRAAREGQALVLAGRDLFELEIMAADLRLRYTVDCDILCFDLKDDIKQLISALRAKSEDLALFIAAARIEENRDLTAATIEETVKINVMNTIQLIHAWLEKKQSEHRLIFLSSVAACRGRSRNSLYGGSKAAVELYLQGLQQTNDSAMQITLVRLGFIDTVQTFGRPGIFYAASPKSCADACWKASSRGKPLIYYPFFWRYIMMLITHLPFFLYRKAGRF